MFRNTIKLAITGLGLMFLVSCRDQPEQSVESDQNLTPMELASKQETEGLLIYGNIAEYNWRPVLEAFKQKYPWIKVETADIGPSVAFERYYSESSVGKHTADMIASAAPDAWARMVAKGEVLEYVSPETPNLPEWSVPNKGVYTISTDPMVIIYNKLMVPEEDVPDSLDDLEELFEEEPDAYRDKVTTYNAISHSFAYDIHWAVNRRLGDEKAEKFFKSTGAVTRPESGGSTMVEKVTGGEYAIGFFVSGITIFPRMTQAGRDQIMGWHMIKDGTPVFHRNIGITKSARSPNSAKLLLDFVLSHEGQVAVGKGGLTPYRSDVTAKETTYVSYQTIQDEVGEENIIHVSFDPDSYEHRDEFLAHWAKDYRLAD